MSKKHQMQWRISPDGPWKYHSKWENKDAALEVITHAHSREGRSFDYRLVAEDSLEAIPAVPETVFVGRLNAAGPSFYGKDRTP